MSGVSIKTEKEIELIAASGAILKMTLDRLKSAAGIGVKLSFLDKLAHDLITDAGAKPAFLNYRPAGSSHPYPASICASIGSTIVHGIPRDHTLHEGDVLKLDLGVNLGGYFSDSALTIVIGGKPSPEVKRLLEGTERALYAGIEAAIVGARLGDIGAAIEAVADRYRLSIAEGLAGHGVGFSVHEDPLVWNYGDPGKGMKLKEGMVIAIEPMFTLGSGEIIDLSDGSYATKDGSLAAHFEHTIAIAESEPIILTA